MELQAAFIDGNIIRESIYDSIMIAKNEILRPSKIFKYGLFKRKKVYKETLEAYEEQFVASFLFQTYLSITMPLEELVEMHAFLKQYELDLLADSVLAEIECRKRSDLYNLKPRTFYETRVAVLSLYLKMLKSVGHENVPMIAAAQDGTFFRIYAPNVTATLK